MKRKDTCYRSRPIPWKSNEETKDKGAIVCHSSITKNVYSIIFCPMIESLCSFCLFSKTMKYLIPKMVNALVFVPVKKKGNHFFRKKHYHYFNVIFASCARLWSFKIISFVVLFCGKFKRIYRDYNIISQREFRRENWPIRKLDFFETRLLSKRIYIYQIYLIPHHLHSEISTAVIKETM